MDVNAFMYNIGIVLYIIIICSLAVQLSFVIPFEQQSVCIRLNFGLSAARHCHEVRETDITDLSNIRPTYLRVTGW